MNNEIATYLHKHTTVIVSFIVLMFVLLGAGEFLLYRNEMKLNMMISEGFIQVKEMKTQTTAPSPALVKITVKPTKTK